jgi:hypothetical protein
MTEIDRCSTAQLILTTVKPKTITLTNPANGKRVTGIAAYGEILKFTETSFIDHQNSLILNFVWPRQGGVLQVIGDINFSENTFSGRDTRATRPRSATTSRTRSNRRIATLRGGRAGAPQHHPSAGG